MSSFNPYGLADSDTGEGERKQMFTGAAAPSNFTPSAGTFQTGVNPQAQASQSALLGQLNQQAMGRGPSIATQQLQQANDQNVHQQAAMAAANRGNPMAAYGAAQNAGAGSQAVSGQAAVARTQEQLNAQQAAMGLSGQMQAQGFAGAGMQNQFGLDSAHLAQQGTVAYNQMMMNQQMAENEQVAAMQRQREAEDAAEQQMFMKGAMGGVSQGAGLLATSDENQKTNVKPGASTLHDFLDKLDAHEYEYKDTKQPGTAPGRHVSVMAQELEKSPTGKSAVVEAPHGKMVDYAKILPAMLAASADAHKRLKSLEMTK